MLELFAFSPILISFYFPEDLGEGLESGLCSLSSSVSICLCGGVDVVLDALIGSGKFRHSKLLLRPWGVGIPRLEPLLTSTVLTTLFQRMGRCLFFQGQEAHPAYFFWVLARNMPHTNPCIYLILRCLHTLCCCLRPINGGMWLHAAPQSDMMRMESVGAAHICIRIRGI